MEELKKSIKEIVEQNIVKVVISNKKDKEEKYNKIVILLKENSKKKYYQIEKYTDKQVFHENIELNMLEEKILEFMESKYKQLSAWATDMNLKHLVILDLRQCVREKSLIWDTRL